VLTKSPMVKKAREGVMEFLLINHPLDCPICDQGGECDLQDQAMAFGFHSSRYIENKRAVEDKYIGPLVRTSMNRCIHCTRCVRFTAEVAGTGDLGATGRGEDMEITTYLETAMRSELQGNIADLCPVGALLPKPYSFKARSWELVKTESIDVMDALGSAIRIDTRGREVMRILPRINDAVNEEWISDKTREIVDGLKTKRLDRPFVRENGKLREASWQAAFQAIAAKVKQTPPERIGAIAGDLCAVEEMFALQLLMQSLGAVSLDCRQDGAKLDPSLGRGSYIFNPAIAGIDQADGLIIIGANPRKESPVLNARIRKRWLKGGFPVSVIGEKADLTYEYAYLGAGPETLAAFAEHPPAKLEKPILLIGQGALAREETLADFAEHPPAKLEKPIFLIGQGALAREDGRAILALAAKAAHALGVVKEGGSSRRGGTASRSCTPPRRGWAASISASCRDKAGLTRNRWRKAAPSMFCFFWAPMRSRWNRALSWSIKGRTAIGARRAPTSSCRARHIPKNPAPMSTRRAACNSPLGPISRPATGARIGLSYALFPMCLGTNCRSIR